jgi:hypothetical protein
VFFCTDEKHIRTKTRLWIKAKAAWGLIQDRRLRTDRFIVRAQSVIRADGPPSAQARTSYQ